MVVTIYLVTAVLLLLLFAQCTQQRAKAETLYYPGDSLSIVMTPRDSLGIAVAPDTVRLFIYRYGAVVESSETFPGDIASLPGKPRSLFYNWVIPTTWEGPYDLDLLAFGEADGIEDEWLLTPSRARINAIPDSVRAVSTAWTAVALTEDVTPDSVRVVGRAWDVRGGHLDSLDLALVAAQITEDLTPDSIRAVGRAWDVRGGHLDSLDLALVAAQITEDLTPDSVRAVGRTWDVRGGHLDSLDLALVAGQLTEEISAEVDSVAWVGYVDTTRFTFRADTTTWIDETITATVGVIDTIAPSAIGDFWQGADDNTAAYVSHASCVDCSIEYNGSPSEALVMLKTGSTSIAARTVGQAQANGAGHWFARVPLEHSRPDTLYMWAWDGIRYLAEAEMIVVN